MGYYTSVEGEITITPPLTYVEFKDSPFNPKGTEYDDRMDVKLRIVEETIDTDEGQLIRRTAPEVIAASGEAYKAYYLVEHVQKLIDNHPDHQFTGRLECNGEESGDLWRCVIRDGRAVKVEPQLIWPDEA